MTFLNDFCDICVITAKLVAPNTDIVVKYKKIKGDCV